jgi:NADH:ubiquinone reductase (H+-translocating)
MELNIPDTAQQRVVIIGAGFGGLTLARRLAKKPEFQVVLIDKNNYHQFQPLFYQVAMAGLEPSSIVFPLRKTFQRNRNVFVRVAAVQAIDPDQSTVTTDIGTVHYNHLVIATGADTNWYGNERIRANAIPMKSVSEALYLRNQVFEDYERAVTASKETRQELLDIVIVGGGPTGVEVAGALAEMKRHIIPKDYHDLDREEIDIHLVHGNDRLLNTMSPQSSAAAEKFLRELGVKLWLDKVVKDYDGQIVTMDDGTTIRTDKVIWAAGITGNLLPGVPAAAVARGNRVKVNEYNQVEGYPNLYVVGDVAFQQHETAFPNGHPQVAQVAIQHADQLANNLIGRAYEGESFQWRPYKYRDLGSMATIGRHRAVVELPFWKFQGALAWFAWLFVHLFALIGTKNKVFVFMNWVWNYFTYDQSLRLVIRPFKRKES